MAIGAVVFACVFGGALLGIVLRMGMGLLATVAVIFVSFGLFAPPNATVVTILFVCALSVSAAIFLILELDQPFRGFIQVSSAPLRRRTLHPKGIP